MNLNQIKSEVLALPGVTAAQVKEQFGDLRKTITWANALEYFRQINLEAIAVNTLTAFCFAFYLGQAVRQWWSTPTVNTEGLLLSLRDVRLSSTVSLRQTWGDLRKRSTWESAYTVALYFAVVLVVGLSKAAAHNWKAWVKPGAIALGQWVSREFQHWLSLTMLAQYE